jgi:sugar lactone lactonase YvrE
LNNPASVSVDTLGNLFIADGYNRRIRKVDINGIITTVAGDGQSGYAGDGGLATNAEFGIATSVAVDSSGGLYVADEGNNRIRKVSTNGFVTTVAGGWIGDDGPPTAASLNSSGAAVDSSGNLFIADEYNNRVRKVDVNGVITTVAGNGVFGYSGDGGAATNASLNGPLGVAVDASGNLFIADTQNSLIRKVATSGIITTVACTAYNVGYSGDGGEATNAFLFYPSGVAVDPSGNFFIADHFNNRVRKVDTNGIITTVAGNGTAGFSGDGGAATNATLRSPQAVAADASGNLFVSDSGNVRIRRVSTNGIITTFAGNGTSGYSGDGGVATKASLFYPNGVAVDASGNLFIADTDNVRIRKVDASGIINTVAGNGGSTYSGDGGLATSASLSEPFGVAVDGLAIL